MLIKTQVKNEDEKKTIRIDNRVELLRTHFYNWTKLNRISDFQFKTQSEFQQNNLQNNNHPSYLKRCKNVCN